MIVTAILAIRNEEAYLANCLRHLVRNQIEKMRPGAEVRARVVCGKTNLAYYLLRKPIQVFYESVLFRWPFLH